MTHPIIVAYVFDVVGKNDEEYTNLAVRFIRDVFQKMQPVHQWGLSVLALCFNVWQFCTHGKTFSALAFPKQRASLKKWEASRIPLAADFASFFLTLTVTAIYDSQKMLDQLGVDGKTYLKLQCFYNSGSERNREKTFS